MYQQFTSGMCDNKILDTTVNVNSLSAFNETIQIFENENFGLETSISE